MSEDLVINQLSYKLFVNHHFTEQSPLLSQMEKTYKDLRLRIIQQEQEQYNEVSAEFPLKTNKQCTHALFSKKKCSAHFIWTTEHYTQNQIKMALLKHFPWLGSLQISTLLLKLHKKKKIIKNNTK